MASPKVVLNGSKLIFDVPPIIDDGRTLVPLRAIFEALGANITWDDTTKTITATKGLSTITLQIGASSATKNGQIVNLDVPSKVIDGRTLVPLRFVSEAMGCDVMWADKSQTVVITDNSDPNSLQRVHSDPKGGFAITYPKNWSIKTDYEKMDLMIFADPADSAFPELTPRIVIDVRDFRNQNVSMESIINQFHINMKNQDPNAQVLSENNITMDGLPGYQIKYFDSKNNIIFKSSFTFNKSLYYEILIGYKPGETEDLIKTLDTVVNSIKLVDPYN